LSGYLVTGGAGFIGSHTAEALLDRGHRVVALDNLDPYYDPELKRRNLAQALASDRFRFVEGDIRDADLVERLLREEGVAHVIHLAAKAGS
jgi:nucleoside-diphosphate-sugar epimerase